VQTWCFSRAQTRVLGGKKKSSKKMLKISLEVRFEPWNVTFRGQKPRGVWVKVDEKRGEGKGGRVSPKGEY